MKLNTQCLNNINVLDPVKINIKTFEIVIWKRIQYDKVMILFIVTFTKFKVYLWSI